MTNIILNIVATGVWQTLGPVENFPYAARSVSLQAREAQSDMYYKYPPREEYWTVKAGHVRTLAFDKISEGELQVMATQGITMEIEISTQDPPNGLAAS